MTAALKQSAQLKIEMNVVGGPHAGQSFQFSKPVITIGRGPENDVVLLNDPLVSRNHIRISLNKNEIELENLSEKNAVIVHGEAVQKCVLVNDTVFQVGDTDIKIQFDLGGAVVSIPTPQPVAPVKPAPPKNLSVVKTPSQTVAPQNTRPKPQVPAQRPKADQSLAQRQASAPQQYYQPPNMQQRPPQFQQHSGYAPAPQQASGDLKKRLPFFLILAILIGGGAWLFLSPSQGKKAAKAKPLLKYQDEVAINLNSQSEADLKKKLEEAKKLKMSPTALRAEENFIKGMRDFQLGNYSRAMDFFQVVLNLVPDHALARRYLFLSKTRFDELIQAKLVLGESNYQKHNYPMCVSMYQQVINMLEGKNSDSKYQLAQRMIEKCQLASEGIR